jgi:hypothetical protein
MHVFNLLKILRYKINQNRTQTYDQTRKVKFLYMCHKHINEYKMATSTICF